MRLGILSYLGNGCVGSVRIIDLHAHLRRADFDRLMHVRLACWRRKIEQYASSMHGVLVKVYPTHGKKSDKC